MKIVYADVIKIHQNIENHKDWDPVLIRIYTDSGIYGDGEAAICYATGKTGAFGMLQDLSKLIIGLDPLDNEPIWEMLYRHTFWAQNGGPIVFAAISAIDTALWDIKAKFFKVPVYVLLGGKKRSSLRCYASQLQFGWGYRKTPAHTVEDYVNNALTAVQEGYDAIKIDFFTFDENKTRYTHENTNYRITKKEENMIVNRVAAVREAVGKDVEIIVENHSYLDKTTAIRIADKISRYDIMYFEEPTTPDPVITKQIADKIDMPVAHGERIYSRWGYKPYFENGSIALAQVDVGNCGGLTEAKKICDMAHAYEVGIQCHVCASPLSTAVALQLESVIPNFTIHEHHVYNRYDYVKILCKNDIQPSNGYINVPDSVGFGNELSDYCFSNGEVVSVK